MTTMTLHSVGTNGTADRPFIENVQEEMSDNVDNGWLRFIAKRVYAHPAVEQLFVSIDDEDVNYWLVIPERDIETVRALVREQHSIVCLFTDVPNPPFQLDFHIIYREGHEAQALVPSDAKRIQKI